MLEFLEAIKSDSDLTMLWRNVINTTDDHELKAPLLVFTDRLEEVGGWGHEANFLRRAAMGAAAPLPARLILPGKAASDLSNLSPQYVHSALTRVSLETLNIDCSMIPRDEYNSSVCTVGHYYSLPRSVWLRSRYFPFMLAWFRVFLRKLPIRHIVIDISRFSNDFIDRYSIPTTASASQAYGSAYSHGITLRMPILRPGAPYSENNSMYHLFRDSADRNADLADRWVEYCNAKNCNVDFTLYRIALWLSHALQVEIGLIHQDGLVFINAKNIRENFDIDIGEAMRFQKDFELDGEF